MASPASSLGDAARDNIPVRISGFVVGAMMPFALYFSTRSSTLFVGIAAALAIWGLWRAGLARNIVDPLRQSPSPALMPGAAFLVLAVASLSWTDFPATQLFSIGEFSIALAVSVALGLAYRVMLPYRFGFGIAVALVIAAAFALIELRMGLTLRTLLGHRSLSFVFNRSIVYQVLLIWPMLMLVERKSIWLAVLAIVMVVVVALRSDSGAAVLALVVGGLFTVLAVFASRIVPLVLAVGTAIAALAAPWSATIVRALIPDNLYGRLQGAHVMERLDIWEAYGQFIKGQPWLGTGFGTSVNTLEHPSAQLVKETIRPWLGSNHPHNAFLQVWVELGAVGAVLFALMAITILASIRLLPHRSRVFACGLAASSLAVMAASHGAWQAWWITSVSALAAIFWAAQDRENDSVRR